MLLGQLPGQSFNDSLKMRKRVHREHTLSDVSFFLQLHSLDFYFFVFSLASLKQKQCGTLSSYALFLHEKHIFPQLSGNSLLAPSITHFVKRMVYNKYVYAISVTAREGNLPSASRKVKNSLLLARSMAHLNHW